jgi:hypothetical protein
MGHPKPEDRCHDTTPVLAVTIAAPRSKVWLTMQSPDGYRDWTSAFCEGSTYEGSWEQGARIRFLAPSGDVTSEIAERREGTLLSIRHLGEIRQGVDDTHSPQVLAWAPAYENFHLRDLPAGGTEVAGGSGHRGRLCAIHARHLPARAATAQGLV